MTKLELIKLAADAAFDTAKQPLPFLDTELAGQLQQVNLSDQDYGVLRNNALQFRNMFVNAYNTDLAIAKRAAAPAAPAPKPGIAPAPATAPAPK